MYDAAINNLLEELIHAYPSNLYTGVKIECAGDFILQIINCTCTPRLLLVIQPRKLMNEALWLTSDYRER